MAQRIEVVLRQIINIHGYIRRWTLGRGLRGVVETMVSRCFGLAGLLFQLTQVLDRGPSVRDHLLQSLNLRALAEDLLCQSLDHFVRLLLFLKHLLNLSFVLVLFVGVLMVRALAAIPILEAGSASALADSAKHHTGRPRSFVLLHAATAFGFLLLPHNL